MRAAPACQFSLRCFGIWRCAVSALTLLGLASIGAWLLTRERPADTLLLIVAASCALACATVGFSLSRPPATDLRWDGGIWHLAVVSQESMPGDLEVAIDLGAWLLLRFVPTSPRAHATWLPVQRLGLEAQWHALRCAVHSPRPALAEDAPVEF